MGNKYFWLKLNENFFNQREIKKLRKLAGGDTLTIIYLKLQLLSIRNNGEIEFEGTEDSMTEQLSIEIDEDAENINMLIAYLQKNALLEVVNDNYFLPKASESIGKESDSAERVRKFRERKTLQCNALVTISNTDIDIDIDKNKRENRRKPALFPFFPYSKYPDTDCVLIQDLKSKFELLWGCWLNTRRGTIEAAKDSYERMANQTGLNEFADRLEIAFGMYMRSEEWNNDIVKSLPKWISEFTNWEEEYIFQLKNNKTKLLEKGKTWERMRRHVESERQQNH